VNSSLARYELGVVLLAVVAVSLGAGAVAVRQRVWPELGGMAAAVVSAVMALATLLTVEHLLGAARLLTTGAVVVGSVGAGIAGAWWGRRRRAGVTPPAEPAPGQERISLAIAAIAVGAVAVDWLARSIDTLARGRMPATWDTWWYHLPLAAYFVQEHGLGGLLRTTDEPVTSFYPADGSLLHATGILLFGSDAISPMLNLGFLALAIAAAYALGTAMKARALVLCSVALVFATPVLRATQPGDATNDILVLALVLAAMTALFVGRLHPAALAVAGMAMGMCIGTKLTLLAAVPIWVLGLIVLSRGARLRAALAVAGPTAVLGATWYLRNLVETGSPVPMVALPGWDRPHSYFLEGVASASVLQRVGEANVWSLHFLPGLYRELGPLWPLLLTASAVGLGAGIWRGSASRVLAIGAVIGILSYVTTPTSGSLFAGQLRHPVPSLAIGLVLIAAEGRRLRGPASLAVTGLAAAAVVVTVVGAPAPLSPEHQREAVGVAIVGAAGLLVFWRPPQVRLVAAVAALTLLAGIGLKYPNGAGPSAGDYAAAPAFFVGGRELAPAFAWSQGVHGARIGYVGTFLNYPLYGRDLSNQVAYIGREQKNGGFDAISDCPTFIDEVVRRRLDYVVAVPYGIVSASNQTSAKETAWLTSAGARPVIGEGAEVVVFSIQPGISFARCP
jgi:hypothetical protein